MKLYKWQKEIVDFEGDQCIVGGRQVGKSIAVAHRIARLALKYQGTFSLIIAASERQESFLLEKVKEILAEKNQLKGRQTLSKLTLHNGSTVQKFPVGKTGYFAKGATIDFLYPDEAGYIAELVWDSVIPMLAVARSKGKGWICLSSTAFGKRGYFYKCFENEKFRKVVIKADEDCPHLSQEFLDDELERMGQRRFDQEYMAKFLDEAGQYFPTDLILKQMNFRFWDKKITNTRKFYLGIDFGGLGADEEAYCVGELIGNKVRNIHNDTLAISRMRETLGMTDKLDIKFNLRKIFIDPSGMGVGYEDIFEERYGKRRVLGLNNASKSKEKYKRIFKEDLYSNCLRLMEEGNLDLVHDEKMAKSLQSIQIIDGKISGKNDHLAEALVRMCWCVKEKGLNLYVV